MDTQGNDTHTASTVVGAQVKGASLYRIGKGTARGSVLSARLAIYKVCITEGADYCYEADMLAGFDDAINDGVDFISLSIGGPPGEYFKDVIFIGSDHAMGHEILTSAALDNNGGYPNTVPNVAPWILTVTATDRAKQYKTTIGPENRVLEK
ncbi:unnamed protein product [Linum tenue]|uniref:Peptidase S8/S53 domain-containing protein n=1 Tax=Linum tenue TaxID=586396 RepID=A0AAV0NJY6_9ROSI|nr:unnamed protein product [Linum tenue]